MVRFKKRGAREIVWGPEEPWVEPKKEVILGPAGTPSDIGLTGSSSSESALGFLGAMANSAEPSPTNSPVPAGMNNKIDDLDYKLDAISKRVNAMLDRLDLVEKKLDRAGRQGALD